MGPYGLFQHANGETPRLEEGYCTDDNARAVQLLVELRQAQAPASHAPLEDFLQRCWDFLVAAQMPDGTFRNFRSVTGGWLDSRGTEDTLARTARALVAVIRFDVLEKRREQARQMLRSLLPHLAQLEYPRGIAEAIIALAELSSVEHRNESNDILRLLWRRLRDRWQKNYRPHWPWPESELTYANALLTHGLLAGWLVVGRPADTASLLRDSARFLQAMTMRDAMFVPIGNQGWYQRGGQPAVYDQQPIEAHTMFDFLLAYQVVAQPPLPAPVVSAPYLWFIGNNSRHKRLVDIESGACCDGLREAGDNLNQGAESLLAFLRSKLLLQQAPAAIRHYVGRWRLAAARRQEVSEFPT